MFFVLWDRTDTDEPNCLEYGRVVAKFSLNTQIFFLNDKFFWILCIVLFFTVGLVQFAHMAQFHSDFKTKI